LFPHVPCSSLLSFFLCNAYLFFFGGGSVRSSVIPVSLSSVL
jgi:hypothetical protein